MNASVASPSLWVNTGIHQLSADAYHMDPCPAPALSASILKILLNQSPAHARLAHPRLNPTSASVEDSRFDLGSAAHTMMLERDHSPVVFIEADDWRTKAAKEARDAARAAGKFPVLARYKPDLEAMVSTAWDALAASEIGTSGDSEQTVIWQEDGGVWCKARVDRHTADKRILIDYKTTDSAEPEAFVRQIGRMGYDLQAEFYLRGWKAITGIDATFVFMCQEISEPYAVSFISLSNAYRDMAQRRIDKAIALWRDCLNANRWPGYEQRIHYAEPPAWMLAQAEQQLQQENW